MKRLGQRYSLWFPDSAGGRKAALARAIVARDRLERSLPPAVRIKRRCLTNNTGVVGVCLVEYATRKGTVLERYSASWRTAAGKRGGANFSVARYGRAEAFRLAVAARERALRQRLGRHAALWLVAPAPRG